jgi:hypothetical protein
MAITEREEMRIASILKREGWTHEMYDGTKTNEELKEMANWCRESFGDMYNNLTMDGKWFGAILPFQAGGIDSKKHVVFMFRDDKLYNLFKVMFPG